MLISASVDEARDSVESLTTVVRQVLQSNQDIVQRLSNLECLSTRGKASQTGRTASTLDDGKSTSSSQSKAEDDVTETPGISLVPFSFDQDLIASWVYSRAERRRSADSLRSSAAVSFGWSCLSEFSLANVSNISVVSLPIDIRELSNSAHYRSLRHATLPRNLYSRNRENPPRDSEDTEEETSASFVRNNRPKKYRRKRPSQKAMLSKASRKAKHAVLLDNAQSFEETIDAYTDVCALLQQVIQRCSDDENSKKLETIVSVVFNIKSLDQT